MGGIQQGSICDKSAFLQLMALVVSQGAITYKAERGVIYNSWNILDLSNKLPNSQIILYSKRNTLRYMSCVSNIRWDIEHIWK